MNALTKANIWKAEYRVHSKHTLISAPRDLFFFAVDDYKLAVQYVNIRQRKYARGIIFYALKIGKQNLVLALIYFLWAAVSKYFCVWRFNTDFDRALF